jgi:hypothetical protein
VVSEYGFFKSLGFLKKTQTFFLQIASLSTASGEGGGGSGRIFKYIQPCHVLFQESVDVFQTWRFPARQDGPASSYQIQGIGIFSQFFCNAKNKWEKLLGERLWKGDSNM